VLHPAFLPLSSSRQVHHLKSEIGERGGRCVCAVDGWQQHFAVGGFIIMGNIVQAATFH